ncbi:MAG TPA: triose-phosphate isomerase [Patescibacteria group bacterium]|nr:triose-phosphate isomerase [Patescibacteria group bacterium]
MLDFTVFVNFKTYPQGTGEDAIRLTQICQAVSQEKNLPVIPIVQAADLHSVKEAVKIPVWVEHLDPQPAGPFTGWTVLETILVEGSSGALLNHSEHPLSPGTVRQIINRARKQSKKFTLMVCAKTLGQMERLVKLKPDFLAYEISELIGGKVAITDFDSKAIKHAVEISGEIPLVVGAGIHKAEDLVKARDLGAKGVLISSAVVLAKDPKEKLTELLKLI